MERALLSQILEKTGGIESQKEGFVVADEHRALLYLGTGGTATVVADIVRLQLHDDYLEAESKNRTIHCILYAPVIGFALKRPRDEDAPRTGF